MKTKTEVINILKGTLAFLSTFYQKVNLVLSFLFILFSQSEFLKMLHHYVFSYSNHHFLPKIIKYCRHDMVLKGLGFNSIFPVIS